MIPVNGVELEVFEAGREHAGRPIVLCHGWPEHAFSWRHQMTHVSDIGAPGDHAARYARGRVSRFWSVFVKLGHASRARLAAECWAIVVANGKSGELQWDAPGSEAAVREA